MPSTCAALGCSNNKALKRRLTFYYFPKKTERRQEWVAAMRRKDWTPTDHSRICSEHFISGMKSNNPLSPDYIPSLFTFLSPEQRHQKINSYLEFQQAHVGDSTSACLTAFDGDGDTEDDSDSSDGVLADEHESQTGKDEDTTTKKLPAMDEEQEAFEDDDAVRRRSEVEAGETEGGGHSAQSDKTNETKRRKGPSSRASKYYSRSSLRHLTRKFAAIIGHPTKVFDLNVVSAKLGVPKRRLYDITNVLQGIRLLEKTSKNLMRWLAPPVSHCLKAEIQALAEEEARLDELIKDCSRRVHRLCEDSYTHGYAYLTYDDLQTVPNLSDQAVIVIKAPSETKLEVSHPHESFWIHLRSSRGPIDVLMCHSDPVPGESLA